MKILVTGATGFVGNHVIKQLIKLNHKVIATSRNIANAKRFDWFEKVKYIPCDLNQSKPDYFEYFEEPDLLVHLSWEGLPNYNQLFHFEKNLLSNYSFIKNIISGGLRNLSVTGTCLEYGLQNGCLAEDFETKPITCYGLAKDTLRKFIIELKMVYDFQFKWIRLFYLYGEGQNKNSIFEQLKEALKSNLGVFNMSGGEQQRDYLPVEKAVEYIIKLSIQNKYEGIFNCCSGTPVSIRRIVEDYLQTQNHSIKLNLGYFPYLEYEPMAFWGNNRKLMDALKYYQNEVET